MNRPDWKINKDKPDIDLSGNVHYDKTLNDAILNMNIGSIHDYPNEFELYQSISNYYKVPLENICIGFGSTDVLSRIIQSLVFNHLYIVEPAFEMIEVYCQLYNIKYTKIRFEDLKHISYSSNVYMANPNGNNGKVYDLSNYHFMTFIVDEAYSEFNKTYEAQYDSNTIVVKTLSKSLGLAGLRVGFCFADKHIINILQNIRMNYIANSYACKIVPVVIKEIPNVISRMQQSKQYLQSKYDCVFSNGNYVLFKQPNKLTDRFGYKLTKESLYRMALTNIELLDE